MVEKAIKLNQFDADYYNFNGIWIYFYLGLALFELKNYS